ncbi:hypothetical protein O181_003014 [Austropuccinia psidii MF-1]|uniref:Reverse transcriptase Ty1/copia-type domain-containing protein n=1 Tax=Austropuccinia psidii MF-1 TaxID=1389203 RepID=A0A9Q3GDE9_9BASI|nr:hypothetical protein [Austropuccinia psidii MF-1]
MLSDMARAIMMRCKFPVQDISLPDSLQLVARVWFNLPFLHSSYCSHPQPQKFLQLNGWGKEGYLLHPLSAGARWLFWIPHFASSASAIFTNYRAENLSHIAKKRNFRNIVNTLHLSVVYTDRICGLEDEVAHSIPPVTCLKLPNSFAVAMCMADACLFKLQKMEAQGMWQVIELQPDCKVIGRQWVFTLMAWAYLYRNLNETVYIQPPVEMFPSLKGKDLHLCKALYGIQKAGRCWWKFRSKLLATMEFTPTKTLGMTPSGGLLTSTVNILTLVWSCANLSLREALLFPTLVGFFHTTHPFQKSYPRWKKAAQRLAHWTEPSTLSLGPLHTS